MAPEPVRNKPRTEPIFARDGSGRKVGTRWLDKDGNVTQVVIDLSEVDMTISERCAKRLRELSRNDPLRHIPLMARRPRRF